MKPLGLPQVSSVALIGAHCDDIAIGLGATLLQLAQARPGLTVHALVLTGGGTEREVEEKQALAAFCPDADVRLTVADLPDGHLPEHWGRVKAAVADLRRDCEPDVVFAPHRHDAHQDHRLLAETVPTVFRDHLVLGYEILKWESDLTATTVYHPVDADEALRKVALLVDSYPSQTGHDWFDHEAFLSLLRVRGAQARTRYAEAFVCEKTQLSFA